MVQSASRACERCQSPTRDGRLCRDCRPARSTTAERRGTKKKRLSAAKRGYDRHWRVARAAYLAEPGNQICHGCQNQLATVVDHIEPHRGDRAKFWDRENWQPLCARCHNAKTNAGA